MARKGRDITDDEAQLFDAAMADVTPIKGAKPPPKTTPATPVKSLRARVDTPPAPVPSSPGPPARDVDRATATKMQRGQMPIDSVLDLHGQGQAQAQENLQRFLQVARGRGYRCVLVITGKGRANQGILKARLPEWVEEGILRDIVLRIAPARPKDGGTGAFYVLLRRQRS